MQYRKKVISGFIWSAGEKFATSAVRIIAAVVVLRYLSPGQFGVVEMLAVFSFIAYTIVDSGFSQALIRKKDASDRDYNSIFYLNIAIAIALYVLLIGLSYPLAHFFRQPELVSFAPVLFLTLPLSALGLIQTTILSRAMDFRTLSKISFVSALTSCALLIALAATGFGPWALIWQTVATEVVKTVLLWAASRWRPGRGFSMQAVKELYGFGSRLFLSGLISQVFTRVTTVIIGRMYSPVQVGLYNQSLKFKDSIATALGYSVHNVSYPALASFQEDDAKLLSASRQVVQMLSFILFPVMAGLILVAPEGFAIAGGEKWLPAVHYFRIFCVSAFFLPLTYTNLNILKAKGEGKTILRAEIIKKTFALAVITAAAFHTVTALAWAYTVWMAFEMCVNAYYGRRRNGYSYRRQAADTLPYLAMSAVMLLAVGGAVRLAGNMAAWSVLGLKISVGVTVYILLSASFRPAAWKETLAIVGKR
ncbi:MAG: lipopolysaccharide biosynthesis protein [Rikenellaceae bacterium]|nr:lipopolysaccharide biosynthesis protein [Rikenellaceae bacterium]